MALKWILTLIISTLSTGVFAQVSSSVLSEQTALRFEKVPEFAFIQEEANKLGIKVYLFGGTASAFAHYVRWDLEREAGDDKYQAERFDYDFTNIYRGNQDLDIVVDGTIEQARKLQNILQNQYPHFIGSKNAWEVRLLRTKIGDKQPLLGDKDFKNQHTDTNSTGMLALNPDQGDIIYRDLFDWKNPNSNFLNDIANARIKFLFSSKHSSTLRFKEGQNPPVLSAIRYIAKLTQYEVTGSEEDLKKVTEMIRSQNFSKLSAYAQNKAKEFGLKALLNSPNVEFAWNLLEKTGLRRKLISLDQSNKSALESLGWWMNKEPLKTFKLGKGDGKTAQEIATKKNLKEIVLSHETRSFIAYESITRSAEGKPNVFISRKNTPGEGAAHGNGFYTRIGKVGAVGTGITIRFKLNPLAREGSDFTLHGDFVVIKNKSALTLIQENLNLSFLDYLKLISSGDITLNDKGLIAKFKRKFKRFQMSQEEATQTVADAINYINELETPINSFFLSELLSLFKNNKKLSFLDLFKVYLNGKVSTFDRDSDIHRAFNEAFWGTHPTKRQLQPVGRYLLDLIKKGDPRINDYAVDTALQIFNKTNYFSKEDFLTIITFDSQVKEDVLLTVKLKDGARKYNLEGAEIEQLIEKLLVTAPNKINYFLVQRWLEYKDRRKDSAFLEAIFSQNFNFTVDMRLELFRMPHNRYNFTLKTQVNIMKLLISNNSSFEDSSYPFIFLKNRWLNSDLIFGIVDAFIESNQQELLVEKFFRNSRLREHPRGEVILEHFIARKQYQLKDLLSILRLSEYINLPISFETIKEIFKKESNQKELLPMLSYSFNHIDHLNKKKFFNLALKNARKTEAFQNEYLSFFIDMSRMHNFVFPNDLLNFYIKNPKLHTKIVNFITGKKPKYIQKYVPALKEIFTNPKLKNKDKMTVFLNKKLSSHPEVIKLLTKFLNSNIKPRSLLDFIDTHAPIPTNLYSKVFDMIYADSNLHSLLLKRTLRSKNKISKSSTQENMYKLLESSSTKDKFALLENEHFVANYSDLAFKILEDLMEEKKAPRHDRIAEVLRKDHWIRNNFGLSKIISLIETGVARDYKLQFLLGSSNWDRSHSLTWRNSKKWKLIINTIIDTEKTKYLPSIMKFMKDNDLISQKEELLIIEKILQTFPNNDKVLAELLESSWGETRESYDWLTQSFQKFENKDYHYSFKDNLIKSPYLKQKEGAVLIMTFLQSVKVPDLTNTSYGTKNNYDSLNNAIFSQLNMASGPDWSPTYTVLKKYTGNNRPTLTDLLEVETPFTEWLKFSPAGQEEALEIYEGRMCEYYLL